MIGIPDFTYPITLEQIVRQNWQWFVVEKHPRSIGALNCLYRSDNTACAIGCCIPDEYAKKWDLINNDIDGSDIESIYQVFEDDYKQLFNGIKWEILKELQDIHDNAICSNIDFYEHMKLGLIDFSGKHNINIEDLINA